MGEDEAELFLEVPEEAARLDLEDGGVGAAAVEHEDCGEGGAGVGVGWAGGHFGWRVDGNLLGNEAGEKGLDGADSGDVTHALCEL